MTTLTIPDLDDELQATLRKLAARHGHSVEEEARGILRQVLTQSPPQPSSLLTTSPATKEAETRHQYTGDPVTNLTP